MTSFLLQVDIGKNDHDSPVLRYTYSWIGRNGHPSSLSFEPGSEAVLLPPGAYRKDDLIPIRFSSIQVDGVAQGMLRYKLADTGESQKVGAAAVGHRLISANLLQKELLTEQEIRETFALPEAASASAHVSQPLRRSKRGAPEPMQDRNPRKKPKTAEQATRAKYDAWAQAACKDLGENHSWYRVTSQGNTNDQYTHSTIKLEDSADCPQFGKTKYRALQKRSWKLCNSCKSIFTDAKSLQRHRCSAANAEHIAEIECGQNSADALARKLLPCLEASCFNCLRHRYSACLLAICQLSIEAEVFLRSSRARKAISTKGLLANSMHNLVQESSDEESIHCSPESSEHKSPGSVAAHDESFSDDELSCGSPQGEQVVADGFSAPLAEQVINRFTQIVCCSLS